MSEVTSVNPYAQAAMMINAQLKVVESATQRILVVAVRNGLIAVEPETAFGLSLGVDSKQDFSTPDLNVIVRCDNMASNEAGAKGSEEKEISFPKKVHNLIHSYGAFSSAAHLRSLSLTYYPVTVLAPSLAMVMGVLSQLVRDGVQADSMEDVVSDYQEIVSAFTNVYDLSSAYILIRNLLSRINGIVETVRCDIFPPVPVDASEGDCVNIEAEGILGVYLPIRDGITYTAHALTALAEDLEKLFPNTLYDAHEELMGVECADNDSAVFVSLSAGEKNTSHTKTPKGKGQPAKK